MLTHNRYNKVPDKVINGKGHKFDDKPHSSNDEIVITPSEVSGMSE